MSLTKKEQRQMDLTIIEKVEAGNATIDSLCELFDSNKKVVKQALNRIEGRDLYVIYDDSGMMSFLDGEAYDEYEEIKAQEAAKPKIKVIKNPQATIGRKRRAVLTKTDTFANAQKRYSVDQCHTNQLKLQIASLQLTLAQHELKLLKESLATQFKMTVEELEKYDDLDELMPVEEEAAA